MKNLTFLLFCLCHSFVYAQKTPRSQAQQLIIEPNTGFSKAIKLTYSKKYFQLDDSTFITKYTLYDSRGEYVYITATNNQYSNFVGVNIEDAGGGVFSHINTETFNYKEPTPKVFGIEGNLRILGGNKYPVQLALTFADAYHCFINIVVVNGSVGGNAAYYQSYSMANELKPSITPKVTKRPKTTTPPIINNDKIEPVTPIKPPVDEIYIDKPVGTDESQIFSTIDVEPKLVGGRQALFKFFEKNFKYPKNVNYDFGGKVIVDFKINKSGNLEVIRVKGNNNEINKEVLRVLNASPRWQPGMNNGLPIEVNFTLPFDIKPEGNK